MNARITRSWLFLWVCLLAAPAMAKELLPVAATGDVIADYGKFMAGRTPRQVTSFRSAQATRMVVDLVIIQEALRLGGLGDFEVRFVEVPNSERERTEVRSGFAVIGSQDYWESDFDDSVYKSTPVIRDGEFEKGLYTTASNAPMLSVANPDGLRNHSAVILNTWKLDLTILQSLHLKELHTVYELKGAARFLALGRADFILLEFSSKPDLSRSLLDVPLVPVPGMKVILPGNRCFMVSRSHPLGEKVFKALSAGLVLLQKKGTIKRALTECGFFQERVRNWRVINK